MNLPLYLSTRRRCSTGTFRSWQFHSSVATTKTSKRFDIRTISSSSGESSRVAVKLATSPLPPNPLGDGNHIRTAAALIIGDEILNGKTLDRNSNCFAQYCFEHGVDLKGTEVVPDLEESIVEAARRLVEKYDFVITSGGIGPTHDDITYSSLAKAFNQKLVYHQETINRMNELSRRRFVLNPEQMTATLRMALFPEDSEVLFVSEDIWVPVVRLGGKLCIFPGIPMLFKKMLYGLTPFLPLPPTNERPLRIQIFTEQPESIIAPYLTLLQERLKVQGIQVGSYPVLHKGVFVSLIGRDLDTGQKGRLWLADVAREVECEVGGRILSEEEVAAQKRQTTMEGGDATRFSKEAEGSLKVEKLKM